MSRRARPAGPTSEWYDVAPVMLCNWFNVDVEMHIEAYHELRTTGHWPPWFIHRMQRWNVVIHEQWERLVEQKVVDAWVAEKLGTPRQWQDYENLRPL